MLPRKTSVGIAVRILVPVLLILALATVAMAAGAKPIKIRANDKCPVCGMFVAKYPDFAAQVIFRDGGYAVFDGVKDMLKYRADVSKYAPGRKSADIVAVYVTNYYTLGLIDGYKAYYVAGSDVYGPMGKELVPFDKKADAMEFMRDHKGKSILTFREINASVLKSLE
jgi:copper chaperone NosL